MQRPSAKKTLVVLMSFFFVQGTGALSLASPCEFITERKACAGLEDEAFRPYEGKNPTVDKTPFEDPKECLRKAEQFAKIVRRGVLSQKTVTVKFKGKVLNQKFTTTGECKKTTPPLKNS